MSSAPALKYISAEEYLEQEELSVEKNEYYNGEIFTMPGASISHNQIVRNTLSEIDQFLKGKKEQVFPSDLKVHIEANSLFTYPDLCIVFGTPQRWNNRADTITNPAVIIEVLSQSTKNYDRGEKFKLYRDIPTLREYILIYSTELRLEKYNKQAPNEWKFTEYKSGENEISIDTINYKTVLSTFYRDVDFSLAEEES